MGVQQDDTSTKSDDFSVSGSEKFGVDVPWQYFPDEIKHIPIKKRRFMLQSPSPMMSQTPSPQCEQSPSSTRQTSLSRYDIGNQTNNRECGSGQWSHLDSVYNQELGQSNGPAEVQHDCSFQSGQWRHLVYEELSEVINKKAGDIEDLSVQDNSVTMPLNCHVKRESETERSTSMKDDRLHWDLNTVMEAWKIPCDDQYIYSQKNVSGGILDDGLENENPEKLEACVRHQESYRTLGLSMDSTVDTEVSIQVINENRAHDNSPCPVTDPISSRSLPREKTNTYATNVVIKEGEDCCGTSSVQLIKMLSTEDVHCVKHDVYFNLAVSEKVVSQIDSAQLKKESREAFDAPDIGTSSTDLVSRVNNSEHSVCKPGKLQHSHPSPQCKTDHVFGNTFGGGQDSEAPAVHASKKESSLHVDLNKPKSFECFGRVFFESHNSNGYGADASNGIHGHMVSVEKLTGNEAGNSTEAFDLADYATSLTGLVSRVDNSEHSVCKAGRPLSSGPSLERENVHIFGNMSEECQDIEAFALRTTSNESSFHVAENKPKSYEVFGKVAFEDPGDHGYDVGGSNSIHGHMVNAENIRGSEAGYSREVFDLPDNVTSSIDLISRLNNNEHSVCISGESHPSHCPVDNENAQVFGYTFEDGQDKEAPTLHATPNESSLHVAMNEHRSYECLGKFAFEDHKNREYDADIFHGVRGHMVVVEKQNGSKNGSESPFEDGELRESVLYSLEENEIEGDTECVDYDSDIRDQDALDAVTQCLSEVGSDSLKNDNNGCYVIQCGGLDASKESSQSTGLKELSGRDKLPDVCRFSCNSTIAQYK